VNTLLAKNQFAEVFVTGNEQYGLVVGMRKNLFIRNSWVEFRNVEDIKTIAAKLFNDLTFDTFVGDQPHATFSGAG